MKNNELFKLNEDQLDNSGLLSKLDPSRWREYQAHDITTDALWVSGSSVPKNSKKFVVPNRPELPKNSSQFHGLWIPEIPYQFITRFTEEGDTVWSVFGGSGTDYRVSKMLNRECIINDINPIQDYIVYGDSRDFNPGKKVKLALLHPPYHDIVKYSEDPADGSNQDNIVDFLKWFRDVLVNVDRYLEDDGYMVIACSNVYTNSEELEIGLYLFQIAQLMGYTLKSHIIKDFGETKGSEAKNYNINYYRQLKGGYNNFYGDNIGIFRKRKSKNDIKSIFQEIINTIDI